MIHIKLPFYSESNNLNCAPTSARSVLAYYGIQKTERELAKLMETDKNKGTPPSNFISGLKKLGLKVEFIHKLTYEESFSKLTQFINQKIPVIVSLNMNVYRKVERINENISWQGEDFTFHYVVVIGFDENSVLIYDNKDKTEKDGKRSLSLKKFRKAWYNERLFGDIIIIYPPNYE